MIAEALRGRLDRSKRDSRRVLLAVSGGADSTALAVGAVEAATEGRCARSSVDTSSVLPASEPSCALVLAHFVHGLRSDQEHSADLECVRRLSALTGIPLVVEEAQRSAYESVGADGGLEAAARELRYDFLLRAARLTGAHEIWTGHTADDQVETVLMRLLRGVHGTLLAGIPRTRTLSDGVTVVRPLLGTAREAIEAYLRERTVDWVEDRTNEEVAFERNRVRREVLPQVEAVWSAVRSDMRRLAAAMGRRRVAVQRAASAIPRESRDSEPVRIDRRAFFSSETDVRLELLYAVLARLGRLDRRDRPGHRFFAPLLGRDPGGDRRLIASRGIRIALVGDCVEVGPFVVRPTESGYLREVVPRVPVGVGAGWTITLLRESDTVDAGRVVHLNRIRRPVVVHSHRAGDCVTRSGRCRSVASMLASSGVPAGRRREVPVVRDRNGVVAVLGSVLGYDDIVRDAAMNGKSEHILVVQS
ncbi:MAG: tRNA lysidine(34) synthetase TilS [Spirochaetota bacterium]